MYSKPVLRGQHCYLCQSAWDTCFCWCVYQRWASAIWIRTSATPQYCGQPNRLRSCGIKKVAELWLPTFKIWLPQFRNSATFRSLLPVRYFLVPFPQLRMDLKGNKKYFLNPLFLWKPKTCLKKTVAWYFLPLIFSPWIDQIPRPKMCRKLRNWSSQVADLKLQTSE